MFGIRLPFCSCKAYSIFIICIKGSRDIYCFISCSYQLGLLWLVMLSSLKMKRCTTDIIFSVCCWRFYWTLYTWCWDNIVWLWASCLPSMQFPLNWNAILAFVWVNFLPRMYFPLNWKAISNLFEQPIILISHCKLSFRPSTNCFSSLCRDGYLLFIRISILWLHSISTNKLLFIRKKSISCWAETQIIFPSSPPAYTHCVYAVCWIKA